MLNMGPTAYSTIGFIYDSSQNISYQFLIVCFEFEIFYKMKTRFWHRHSYGNQDSAYDWVLAVCSTSLSVTDGCASIGLSAAGWKCFSRSLNLHVFLDLCFCLKVWRFERCVSRLSWWRHQALSSGSFPSLLFSSATSWHSTTSLMNHHLCSSHPSDYTHYSYHQTVPYTSQH